MLFCAAQAPELFGRDQRYGVLPLYFSRVLTRFDYALAKIGGLFLAVLAPLRWSRRSLLFIGRVLVAPDPVTGLADELGAGARVRAQALADRGPARRRRRPDRGLDARGGPTPPPAIIAVFIIPPIVVALVAQLVDGDAARLARPVQPGRRARRAQRRDLRRHPRQPGRRALDLPGWSTWRRPSSGSSLAIGLTVRRYQRIACMTEPTGPRDPLAPRAADPPPDAGRRPSCRPLAARPRLALVRQRRRGQRHLVRPRPGRHRPARPQRRRQVDPAAPDRRAAAPSAGSVLIAGAPPGGDPTSTATSASCPSARPSTRTSPATSSPCSTPSSRASPTRTAPRHGRSPRSS